MTEVDTTVSAGPAEEELEQYRVELTGYCYRMLGSGFEAEDAVQETMVRAWKSLDTFEGRSKLRSWLYTIATNVCLTMSGSRQRRAQPMDLGPSSTAESSIGPKRPELPWIEPVPTERVVDAGHDPAEASVLRESIRLAFVVALQYLPPRQRAALILCDVLRWKADEAAALLETSVASINSALQRARATLQEQGVSSDDAPRTDAPSDDLVRRYADSFERYDMDALVSLLREDVIMSMPPYDFWLQGSDQVRRWMLGQGHGCEGSRTVPISVNGQAGIGQYRPDPSGGHMPWAVVFIGTEGDQITGITSFLDTPQLFPYFGLPDHLD